MTAPANVRQENSELQERVVFEFEASLPVAASGLITCDTNANMADGNTVTIGDGVNAAVVYEYDKSANGVAGGHVSWTAGTTAATVAANLRTAILATQALINVVDNADGTLTVSNKIPGAFANVAMAKSSASALAVAGMTGGADPGETRATTTHKRAKCLRALVVDKVEFHNKTGLVQDAANYFDIELKNGSTSMAKWSTLTGAQGTIAADTFVTVPLSATAANLSAAAGDVLSLVLTLHGTQTLPPGRLVVHARYL